MNYTLLLLLALGQPADTLTMETLPSVLEEPTPATAPAEPAPVKLEFTVDGPKEKLEGELVVITIMFPEGALADADFTPVGEKDFTVDPIIAEFDDGSFKLVGRKCSFSTRCMGARSITVVASSFATLSNGQPRVRNIQHIVEVKSSQDPDDGWIPIPAATAGIEAKLEELKQSVTTSLDKHVLVLDNLVSRVEALEAGPAPAAQSEKPVERVVTPPPAASASSGAGADPWSGLDIASLGPGWVIKECGVPVTPYRLGSSPVNVAVRQTVQAPLRAGTVPSTGGRWDIEGNRNASYAQVIAHLREPKHTPFSSQYEPLTQYAYGQLRWIHDEHHDMLEGRGYSMPAQRFIQPLKRPRIFQGRASACPGGVCPL